MRVRTLEIRWHDQKPISTCDFQPISASRKPRASREQIGSTSYRLATGGEDNNVRVWLVRPNIVPLSAAAGSSSSGLPLTPHPPRVEYRSTLTKHSGAVNVVRFSPNGELIASAGDDGMIIIWVQTDRPVAAAYGSEGVADEDPEHWKVRISFRCTTNEIYDLAWSPTGEYVIAGSTDNAARIFSVADGTCVRELAEHTHYVQGVAWDPMNEFIATQSSDRAVHVYSVSTKQGALETHAVGRNMRMNVRHSRTPSASTSAGRPRIMRRSSTTSDAESSISEVQREDAGHAPPTPATSIASTPTMFPPPQVERPSSRRSSFSGSNAAGSPAPSSHGHFGRSPSPMPPLPAIRPQSSGSSSWSSVKLYGDESFTNFFRRLTFSPDGAMLLTPAGQFEDPSVVPGSSSRSSSKQPESSRGRKHSTTNEADPASSVYIYTRANFARPPVAQLPGHKKPSVAVKFSPVLYELRHDLAAQTPGPKRVTIERGQDSTVDVDLGAAPDIPGDADSTMSSTSAARKTRIPTPTPKGAQSPLAMPVPHFPPRSPSSLTEPLPNPGAPPSTAAAAGVFALPYRMLFAIATMDTITIHDTQQAGPVCMFTKLHYDEFTDMTWSPDGQCLMLSSRDGFCTIIVLDEYLPAYHTQQHTLQLQSLAHAIGPHQQHAPTPGTASASSAGYSAGVPAHAHLGQGHAHAHSQTQTRKRSEPPGVSSSSEENVARGGAPQTHRPDADGDGGADGEGGDVREPAKKKRRVMLTRVGDLDS
ncbi:WD40-repeat-containing domain protein [Gautieria morchelliformis]|nr:WD40-repeat-containing domain protein [Gautieria morchelliformis]